MNAAVPPPLPPPIPQTSERTSALAVVSVALGVVGLVLNFLAIPAVVCGHLALRGISRSQGRIGGRIAGIIGLCLGYVGVLCFAVSVMVLGSILGGIGKSAAVGKSADPLASMFDLSHTPLPSFPEIPSYQVLADSPVRVAQIDFAPANRGSHSVPGSRMKIRVYLPLGEHVPHSLGCVLVAPGGTNMLVGNDLDSLEEDTSHDEALPYAKAGLVAIQYSLDGARDEAAKGPAQGWDTAYRAFRAAGAGTVNARNALEFALHRLPMVDPGRIYSAGHSSAGTVSLLFGAAEPRLRGCIAYAPGIDLEEHLKEIRKDSMSRMIFPELDAFLRHASPLNQVARIKMPVFLFQARDDSKSPYLTTMRFVEKLKETNPDVTFVSVETGDHYLPMIEEGIPAAIKWIQTTTAATPVEAGR